MSMIHSWFHILIWPIQFRKEKKILPTVCSKLNNYYGQWFICPWYMYFTQWFFNILERLLWLIIIRQHLGQIGKKIHIIIRPSSDGTYYVMALSVRRPAEFVRAITPDPLCRFEQYFTQLLLWTSGSVMTLIQGYRSRSLYT
jgi:hypothetical protein